MKAVLFRVKFMRCAESPESIRFYSNTIKLTDNFMSCVFFRLMVKYLQSDRRKIIYEFFENTLQRAFYFSGHAAG